MGQRLSLKSTMFQHFSTKFDLNLCNVLCYFLTCVLVKHYQAIITKVMQLEQSGIRHDAYF